MNRDIMRRGNNATTELGYINRVRAFSSRLEYIGNEKDFLLVICKDCGAAFKRSKECFKPSHRHKIITCPNCEQSISRAKAKEDKRQKDERYTKYLQQLEAWRVAREEKRRSKIKTYICFRCGDTFESAQWRKYCSNVCMKRQQAANKDHRRRVRSTKEKHDTISLKALARRDKNVCWICKRKVNWQDFETRSENTFITGINYPSIDHVIPLAKGGAHTWANVKLAHRGCNTKKSDSLMIEERNGQMKIAF